jgi:hypothetical protein
MWCNRDGGTQGFCLGCNRHLTEQAPGAADAFVHLRDLAGNKELAQRLKEHEDRLERKLAAHDQTIADIWMRSAS